MAFIKKAFIKQDLGGGGELIAHLELVFADGNVLSTAISGGSNLDFDAVQPEIAIPELSGLSADEELINAVEEMEFTINDRIKNFHFVLSLALLQALAESEHRPLFRVIGEHYGSKDYKIPTPIVSYFFGAGSGDTDLDFNEYLIVPALSNKDSVRSKIRTFVEIWGQIASLLRNSGYDSTVGRSGGFAADIASSISVFSLLEAGAINAGWRFGADCGLGVAVGGHHLYNRKTDKYIFGADHSLSGVDLLSVFNDWISKHHLIYLEDPSDFSDKKTAEKIFAEMGNRVILSSNRPLAGDDLLLRKILAKKMYNTVCLSINDFSKLSQFYDFARIAAKHNLATVLVNGEDYSTDTWVADLAVALDFDFVRFGSIIGSQKAVKYNRLAQIESELAQ